MCSLITQYKKLSLVRHGEVHRLNYRIVCCIIMLFFNIPVCLRFHSVRFESAGLSF